jgi:hypothetical protein
MIRANLDQLPLLCQDPDQIGFNIKKGCSGNANV